MPVNVIGSTTGYTETPTDTSSFVQKPILGTSYNESIVEGVFQMKSQFRLKIWLSLFMIMKLLRKVMQKFHLVIGEKKMISKKILKMTFMTGKSSKIHHNLLKIQNEMMITKLQPNHMLILSRITIEVDLIH